MGDHGVLEQVVDSSLIEFSRENLINLDPCWSVHWFQTIELHVNAGDKYTESWLVLERRQSWCISL